MKNENNFSNPCIKINNFIGLILLKIKVILKANGGKTYWVDLSN